MHQLLIDKYQWFIDNGFYLIFDSAYLLLPFLITPYDGVKPASTKDTCNHHLSSCCTYVECAFGAIYQRWGIPWRPLAFNLVHNIRIVDNIFRIHNCIVQYELDNNTRTFDYDDDKYINQEVADH